ncbi:MAG: BRCT domain-containing protein [Limisphaerales bacterium]
MKKNGNPPLINVTGELEYEVCKNASDFFESDSGQKVLKRLAQLGINPKSPSDDIQTSVTKDNPFFEKSFVLTGTLKSMTRDKATEEIRARGGNVVGSVSNNTDYVLAGEEAGSKLERAQKLGIKILTEKEFFDLLVTKSVEKKQSELF